VATAASTRLFAEGGFPLLSTIGIGLALPLLLAVASLRVVPRTGPNRGRATDLWMSGRLHTEALVLFHRRSVN
jgi:hypothetical protein